MSVINTCPVKLTFGAQKPECEVADELQAMAYAQRFGYTYEMTDQTHAAFTRDEARPLWLLTIGWLLIMMGLISVIYGIVLVVQLTLTVLDIFAGAGTWLLTGLVLMIVGALFIFVYRNKRV